MPILIIEQHGQRKAGKLGGRVLIGRWPDNTIVIDDNAVSRIHAWVGMQDGHYYIADAGSRTGTFVNWETLHERRSLNDGDQIRIGPAILRYHTGSALPGDATRIDLTPRSPHELSGAQGVFMDCACGAPLWLPREFTGVGQCRYCGRTVEQDEQAAAQSPVPNKGIAEKPAAGDARQASVTLSANRDDENFDRLMDDAPARPKPLAATRPQPPTGRRIPPPAPIARPVPGGPNIAASAPAKKPVSRVVPVTKPPPPKAAAREKTAKNSACGICHAPLTASDEIATCPSCGLIFHSECWEENLGCSAYGCPQVGAGKKE